MKISYIAPCLGACALLLFPACKSTDSDGYTETALPMSEVADGEIPPWLLEDDGTNGAHVDAGPRTPSRNDYSIPEPDETPAGAGSSRQNQPQLAAAGQDDSFVETSVGTDPLLTPGATPHPMDNYTPTYTPPKTPKTTTASTGGSKKGTGKSSGSKKGSSNKRIKQPTMVVYKVRPGDNLSEIAKRSNTTVSQIMRDSKLKSTTIHPGQTIKVRYTPKGYNAAKNNGKGATKGKGGKTHTITSGQTLSGIAKRYGVTTSQLMKANGLTEADAKKIRPGQQLTIPSKGKR